MPLLKALFHAGVADSVRDPRLDFECLIAIVIFGVHLGFLWFFFLYCCFDLFRGFHARNPRKLRIRARLQDLHLLLLACIMVLVLNSYFYFLRMFCFVLWFAWVHPDAPWTHDIHLFLDNLCSILLISWFTGYFQHFAFLWYWLQSWWRIAFLFGALRLDIRTWMLGWARAVSLYDSLVGRAGWAGGVLGRHQISDQLDFGLARMIFVAYEELDLIYLLWSFE